MSLLQGHVGKKIEREIRKCIIEEGFTEDQCLKKLEETYILDTSDKKDVNELIGYYKNL